MSYELKQITGGRKYIDYSVWRRNRINHNPRQVNDWWWAIGPYGGSIRKHADGKWYHHPSAPLAWKQPTRITGPFETVDAAISQVVGPAPGIRRSKDSQ